MSKKLIDSRTSFSVFRETTNSVNSRLSNKYKSVSKQQNALTDEEIQDITKRALKDILSQKQPNIEIVNCIKGKPYCLRLGQKQPSTNNFKTFYNKFYSTIYNDKVRIKSLLKPDNRSKQNMLVSRTMKKSSLQPNLNTRQSIKEKFTKKFDTLIDSCNEIITSLPSISSGGGNLYTISESKPKRIY